MPIINRNDFLEIKKEERDKGTNYIQIIDKFLGNQKIQEAILNIIKKFQPQPQQQQQPQQQPQQQQTTNIQNEEEIIKKFLKKIVDMGQGNKTVAQINDEIKKL